MTEWIIIVLLSLIALEPAERLYRRIQIRRENEAREVERKEQERLGEQ